MEAIEDLEQLAETCLSSAKAVKEYLAIKNLPQPTFNENGPTAFPPVPPEIQYARLSLRAAAQRLNDLMRDPEDFVHHGPLESVFDISALRYVVRFNLAQAVPVNGSISYAELAAKSKVDADQMKRSIRQAIHTHVFYEPQPGYVGHTTASRLLLNPQIASSSAYTVDDTFVMAVNVMTALEKWGHGSQEPTEAGLSCAFNTDKPMFQFFEENELLRERFSSLMKQIGTTHLMSTDHVGTGFDWASLGECTVVDIGGNKGHCSIPIARSNSKAKIIVQDLPELVQEAQSPGGKVIPPDLEDRISFMAHNFYEPQPIQADAYFIRLILHDYSDKYAAKILSALLPAMKPGNRIILMELIMPPVGAVPPPIERYMRTLDLVMWMILNGKEREIADFDALLKRVDQRLTIKNVVSTPGSALSVIEVLMEEHPSQDNGPPV